MATRSRSIPALARRPRMIALAAVAAAGLAVAVWLPARNDSASASENGQHASSGWRHDRHDRDRDRDRDWRRDDDGRESASPDPGASASEEPPSSEPTTPPTEAPTEAPTSEPTTAPTSEPPVTTPPTTEPTTAPTTVPPTTTPTTPPTTAPAAKAWAAFTIYLPGQLVSFGGKNYQVLAAHTSLPGWEPTKLPALFKVIG